MAGITEKKRKQEAEESAGDMTVDSTVSNGQDLDDSGDEDDDDDASIVNVDFDFFNPEEIDYHAIKNLLRQLLDVDSVDFDLSSLADRIIKQSTLGSTIKTDGKESDPFALLTILNMKEQKEVAGLKSLGDYFIKQTSSHPEINRQLRKLLTSSAKESVGLVIQERLINMPTEVVPPMYKMLLDEIKEAETSNDAYKFDWVLVLSKTFTEEESTLDQEDARPSKKTKSQKKEVFYFHPEDEVLDKHAVYSVNYPLTHQSQESDSKRAFQDYGIYPRGHLALLKFDKLKDAVKDMEDTFPPY